MNSLYGLILDASSSRRKLALLDNALEHGHRSQIDRLSWLSSLHTQLLVVLTIISRLQLMDSLPNSIRDHVLQILDRHGNGHGALIHLRVTFTTGCCPRRRCCFCNHRTPDPRWRRRRGADSCTDKLQRRHVRALWLIWVPDRYLVHQCMSLNWR